MRLGVDLGGTKIELRALDPGGAEVLRYRVPTPQGDYEQTVAAIAQLVHRADEALGCKASVGIGTPGALSPATGRMKNANSTCLIGRPLDVDVAQRVGRDVRLANDADCLALSEATDGAAARADPVFAAILGTGVGGGLVVGGRLVRGRNGIAGEWGHNPLPWPNAGEAPGPPCYCGRSGCIETFVSGPGLARDHTEHNGGALTAAQIAQAAQAGNQQAVETLERFCHRLARGLASVINVLDPEVIVLGGGLSQLALLYDRVPELWQPYVFSDRVDTQLVAARFGDASGVRGAAWLWPQL